MTVLHDNQSGRLVEALSKRESAVLRLTAEGLTNQEIADRLSVSVHGVKFHLGSIFRKLGVENRTAAAALYLHEIHHLTEPNGLVE